MKMADIQKIAKKQGINTFGMKKAEAIRAIQKKEGNPECFGNAINDCSQKNCLWYKDCLDKLPNAR